MTPAELEDMLRDTEWELADESERFAREATSEQKAERRRQTLKFLFPPRTPPMAETTLDRAIEVMNREKYRDISDWQAREITGHALIGGFFRHRYARSESNDSFNIDGFGAIAVAEKYERDAVKRDIDDFARKLDAAGIHR